MNLGSGDVDAYVTKEIVDNVEDEFTQIVLKDAQVCAKRRCW